MHKDDRNTGASWLCAGHPFAFATTIAAQKLPACVAPGLTPCRTHLFGWRPAKCRWLQPRREAAIHKPNIGCLSIILDQRNPSARFLKRSLFTGGVVTRRAGADFSGYGKHFGSQVLTGSSVYRSTLLINAFKLISGRATFVRPVLVFVLLCKTAAGLPLALPSPWSPICKGPSPVWALSKSHASIHR